MDFKKTQQLTIKAVFIALLLIQTFVPNIGYIRIIPTLPAVTTIPLTVVIYASLFGSKKGALFGGIWGITSLFVAYTQPGDIVSLMIFQNPVIAILPRIISGWVAGYISNYANNANSNRKKSIWFVLAGFCTSLVNTVLVITLTSLFFMNNTSFISHLTTNSTSNSLFVILIIALGFNGILEAIFTALCSPLIIMPIKDFINKKL